MKGPPHVKYPPSKMSGMSENMAYENPLPAKILPPSPIGLGPAAGRCGPLAQGTVHV
jgi:hypothetical protein